MYIIKINRIQLRAPIGWYEAEQTLGNEFELNITLEIEEESSIASLADTVNYAEVTGLVRQVFQSKKYLLLEPLVYDIGIKVLELNHIIKKVQLELLKKRPHLSLEVHSVAVLRTFEKD